RCEIQVPLAVVVPEMSALGTGDRDRVDRVLHRPGVEDVLLRVLDDPRSEVGIDLDGGHAPILARVERRAVAGDDGQVTMAHIGGPSALLERESALEHLTQVVADAAAGVGSLVLVEGETGVGKTALLRRFVERLSGEARTLWGSCDPLFTPRPLGPFL